MYIYVHHSHLFRSPQLQCFPLFISFRQRSFLIENHLGRLHDPNVASFLKTVPACVQSDRQIVLTNSNNQQKYSQILNYHCKFILKVKFAVNFRAESLLIREELWFKLRMGGGGGGVGGTEKGKGSRPVFGFVKCSNINGKTLLRKFNCVMLFKNWQNGFSAWPPLENNLKKNVQTKLLIYKSVVAHLFQNLTYCIPPSFVGILK